MTAMTPKACWYCDGTVWFDSDGFGECDNGECRETYSASEFLQRRQHTVKPPKVKVVEYDPEPIPDDLDLQGDF